jgi:uncharacterized repeat protein (TIGR03803 family)
VRNHRWKPASTTRKALTFLFLLFAMTMTTATAQLQAQTHTVLHSFDWTDGASAIAGLVQGLNGNLYGAATYGGAAGNCQYSCAGTIFEITPSGVYHLLYQFCSLANCADGNYPYATLLQATNGNLYGTTLAGGAKHSGTVFEITPSGRLTTLHSFCSERGCADGESPTAALIEGADHNFYGTTEIGGRHGGGTVFKITPAGKLITLYSFCALDHCSDGESPHGGLVQGSDGNFYGTTTLGGFAILNRCDAGCGTVFELTSPGMLTTLYTFCSRANCNDGWEPVGGLVQAADGNFYGTTLFGGIGEVCGAPGCGTIFQLTPPGTLTTLHSFCIQSGCPDSFAPFAGLTLGSNGLLYGTAEGGGNGAAFKITTSGKFKTIYNFCSQTSCLDGAQPYSPLMQATNGNFYGTTYEGGSNYIHLDCPYECGTVFGISTGLAPFVETLSASGALGTSVVILGNNLTGSTSVNFNGTAAAFTVVSSAEITATVPADATTGKITVTTGAGVLTSNIAFRVTP